jgi:hypothetical protein
MNYLLNGKNIKIPDDEIVKNMKVLSLSKEDAIQLYLEDEGYLDNEIVEELTAKAKENKTVNHDAKSDKVRKKTVRTRKPDEEKEKIIEFLTNCLKNE